METLEFSDGEKIIEKDDRKPYIYIIKTGTVKAIVGGYETLVSSDQAADMVEVFGLEALVGEPYSETCIAVGAVKVIRCEKNEFLDIYAKTEVGKNALKNFMKRTAKALGWI
ncbi:MAG: cyclic nucleotide-binding domain-containing protein [Fervidobacterium sp.]|uniref:Cyclic nucleotide-binding domain-containing protein n=1 Tax=Fervidobacterium gondwanense DSM 13020 TaxID=1121883 RepID=A0A1M7SQP9_FERGO|nr:cyclic nucleotide-binding domain-containing protein [Fervidobacterium gondwanense]UXF00638.1 cyclic nucleotide-binding protein [Fervidobacterium riparium]SHN60720.1 Cyclic nucleotide-binding domain-containing protein [Fervidobacterium gondwanense DSM 13020]